MIQFDFYRSVGSTKLTSVDYPLENVIEKLFTSAVKFIWQQRGFEKGNCNGNKVSSIKLFSYGLLGTGREASHDYKCVISELAKQVIKLNGEISSSRTIKLPTVMFIAF